MNGKPCREVWDEGRPGSDFELGWSASKDEGGEDWREDVQEKRNEAREKKWSLVP